jgi:hypothetical protein
MSEIAENFKIHHLFKKHFMREILVLLKKLIFLKFKPTTYYGAFYDNVMSELKKKCAKAIEHFYSN